MASHWMPFWRWCGVCQKDNRFDYVIDMHHMEEDKNFMFAELGIETEVEAKQQNPTVKGNAASDETKKK